jgi:hypothetical protein
MTKKLEDFFNVEPLEIDRSESTNEDQLDLISQTQAMPAELVVKEQLSIADRIDNALPQVKGLDIDDGSFDEYAEKAMDSYEKLMDLGMNVDDRNAGQIFDVASKMMNNAISAKTAKLEKKLKMVELQLRAARLANDTKEKDLEPQAPSDLSTDRNAILNLINQNLKNKQ